MEPVAQIEEMLMAWETAGGQLSSEELCRDRPDFLDELRKRIRLLEKFHRVFGADDAYQALDEKPVAYPVIPHCEIRGELGRGGMGTVYRAWQQELAREVAVKVMRPGQSRRPEGATRFAREARLLARLRHEGIVSIFHAEFHQGQPFFVMELIAGGNLAEARRHFDGNPRVAARLAAEVADAVHHAHQNGVLHRDLKPSNVLLDATGRPRVSDFGLAKLLTLDAAPAQEFDAVYFQFEPHLTAEKGIVGTPAYMAPEQYTGPPDAVSPRTDIWSLGVILYELLGGRRPFDGANHAALRQAVCVGTPPKLRSQAPAVDAALEAIVMRCLEKNPARRYSTAEELGRDLRRWLAGEPVYAYAEGWRRRVLRRVRRHPILTGAAVLALVIAAAVSLVVYGAHPERAREAIERALADQRPATLIAQAGPPRHFSWLRGADVTLTTADSERPFFVSTQALALVELWRNPPASYCLRAEVRHDENPGDGCVGLFFAYRGDVPGVPPSYCALTYRDRGNSVHFQRGPDGTAGRRIALNFEYLNKEAGSQPVPCTVENRYLHVPPSPLPGSSPWREIQVRVRPENVTVLWKNDSGVWDVAADVDRDGFLEYMRVFKLDYPDLSNYNLSSFAEGSVGLYVNSSSASFRNVVLEPYSFTPPRN